MAFQIFFMRISAFQAVAKDSRSKAFFAPEEKSTATPFVREDDEDGKPVEISGKTVVKPGVPHGKIW